MVLIIQNLIFFIIVTFFGYLLGRFGHYYLNSLLKNPDFFHHWIYGIILIILGIIFNKNSSGFLMLFSGIGLFTSDLNDSLHLKFYGLSKADKKTKKKFWGFD